MQRITERKTSCWIKTKSGKDYTNYTQDWDAISKLAAYEDTGLTTERIRELAERDTAKAPVDTDDEFDMYVCPSCDMAIGTMGDKRAHNFCLNCGQRLKWEEGARC
mgnify:FL=1